MKTSAGQHAIRASAFSRIVWERKHPWGQADTIYKTTGPEPMKGGGELVEPQLQSGDVLRIEAPRSRCRLRQLTMRD